jgi:hypothetical protein
LKPEINKATWPLRSLLALLLAVCSWQFSATARAQTAITFDSEFGSGSSRTASSTPTKGREHAKAFGVDGIDCITADDVDEEPLQICEDSSDPTNDPELSESALADKATIPSRDDQDLPHFAGTGFDAATLRTPHIGLILPLPVHCFYCLHEHIRERAPPFAS